MATQQDLELNKRLLSIADIFARGDQRIREGVRRMIGAQEDVIEAYEDHLKQQRDWSTKEGQQAKATLIRLKKIEQEEESARSNHINQLRRISATEQTLLRRQATVVDRLSRATTDLQRDRYRDELTNIQRQMEANRDSLREARRAYGAQFTVIREAATQRRLLESQQLKLTTVWGQQLRGTIGSTLETAIGKIFSPALLGKAIKDSVSAITLGAKTGGYGVGINPFGSAPNIFQAAKLGLTPEDFIQMQAEMRRTILSTTGGMTDFVASLEIAADKYSDIILDPAERTKIAAQQLEMFTRSGVRFVKQDVGAFASAMATAAKYAGMAPEQFNAALGEIIDSEETQARLKAATSEQERRAILMGVQAQFAQSKAMGLTTEQAKAAAKALNKLAGQGPLERYKQAAKLRAFGAAMGMGGEANAAADILIKGKRATAEEQAQLQQTLGKMSESLTQTATGSMGAEIFASTLADKLQLAQLLGPESPFNTTLAQAISPLEKATDTLSQIPPELRQLVNSFKTLYSQITNNPLLTGAAGAVGVLGAKSGVGGVASRLTKMFGGKSASAAGGVAESLAFPPIEGAPAASGLSSATRVANFLSKTLKIFGPIASVGAGAYEGFEEYKKTGAMGRSVGKGTGTAAGGLAGGWAGGLAGASAGAALGSFVPVLGTAAGALIGGLLGAAGGGWGGGALGGMAGSTIGSTFDNDTERRQDDVRIATTSTAEGIQQQVKQMDQNNELLKKMADSQDKLVELNERQLDAIAAAGRAKDMSTAASSLRRDNRFNSRYGYVN